MQPSGPNRPIELPSHLNATSSLKRRHRTQHQAAPYPNHFHSPYKDPAGWPGGHRKVDTPDPIPNSAVKHLSAHGTVAQATGESVAAGPPSRILVPNHLSHTLTTAGWSSPVARQAHNLKVTGSNPVPASIFPYKPAEALIRRGSALQSCLPLSCGRRPRSGKMLLQPIVTLCSCNAGTNSSHSLRVLRGSAGPGRPGRKLIINL